MTKKVNRTAIAALALAAGLAGTSASAALTPVDLRCALRFNPMGIGDTNPRLSWQLQGDGTRGQMQSAYEIQVGSSSGAADLWDSGKVTGSQTVDIVYGGQALTNGEQCFWQVRVYDGNGNVSPYSEPAQWTMGLLNQTGWTAQWIGYDAAYNPTPGQATNNTLYNTSGLNWVSYSGQAQQGRVFESALRKQVVMPAGQTITNAVMALYADNSCNVYVNGQQMTNSAVTNNHPGASAMRWEATAWINVTPWLHSGTNELALDGQSSDAQNPAAVIGKLVVQFASGSITNIPVDTTWKAAQWPSGNWTQTNYNDSSWATPSSGGTSWGTPALNDIARIPAPYLRKSFVVNNTVTRATVYVTALGAYELHLNGQKVGNDVLTPGWTQFTKRVYYQTYDVTGMMQQGTNVIGAILGDGWYASDLAFKGTRQNYGGTPRFLAQLVLQFSDGSTQTVVSDGSWQASYGPILYGDLLIGSGYDARLEMPGWDTTNFNSAAWSPVALGVSATGIGYSNVTSLVMGLETNNQLNFVANNTTMGGDPAYGIVKTLQINFTLGGTNQTETFGENSTVQIGGGGQTLTVSQALYGDYTRFPGNGGLQVQAAVTEPSRCFETLAATNLTQPVPGCYTFDLGQNIAGWVQLNISGQVGDRITIRHGEMLNPDGTVYTANLRGATATDFYTFATNGSVVFQPRFTFHGFRYVEVRGLSVPPTINSVTGIVVHSDIRPTGSFSCSSSLLNQLYSNIIWGQKGNYLEVPTDCPQRDERMGWTGDTEFFVPTAVYNFDVQSFFRRHLRTLCLDSQESDGSFANVAPDLGAGSGAAAWGDAAWICTDIMYHTYADTNMIGDNYSAFQTYGQFLAAHATTNFTIPSLPGDFGDWLNLGGGASEVVIDTAFYAYYAQSMAEMAAAIGKSSDAATYATLHSNIVSTFATFFSTNGSFTDGSSQAGYALAFTLNLVPPALQSLAAQQFANTITQFDNHLATGFIGTPRLLLALHNIGRDDLAYTLLLQQTYPSWLYQVLLGSTTMWERWDGWTPSGGFESTTMNSFNHYAFGAVGQYLYSGVGGINSTSPGYKTLLIKPVIGTGLTWANTGYNSVNGLISTAWTNTSGALSLEVVIPPNTTAQIYVPATNANIVTESGVPASTAPGVTYLGFTNNYAIYGVGSGDYVWSSFLATPPTPPTVTETDAVFQTNASFPPLGQGDLITNKTTSMVANTIVLDNENQAPVTALYDGKVGSPGSTNQCCEISSGLITFNLGPGPNGTGYTITNLQTYTAWRDNGRENANYAVSYSSDGTNFSTLATVSYNPSAYPTHDGTGGTWTSLSVSNLTGVQYLQWNFSANQQNGGVGYSELAAFGPSGSLPAPFITGVAQDVQGSFLINANGLVTGHSYQLQSTTNLSPPQWSIETNFIAAQAGLTLTNFSTNSPQKFYRILGH